ncbi:MAG: 3-keto-5-aminohexanoate cleavage protein [Candidatus Bathyarchaeia archaeon]
MDKKLCIIVCPTGALIDRNQNPNQPYSPKEIAKETIESYNAGACMVHLHTRDENGIPLSSAELLKETLDLILDECPDILAQPSVHLGFIPEKGDYSYESVKPMVDTLRSWGSRYMQSTIFTPISYVQDNLISLATEKNTVETIRYLQGMGVKPEFMCHNWEAMVNIKEWLIKPGILEKPYFTSLGPGMHNAADTYPDPWGHLYLIGMINMMPEDSVIGTSVGGHNWLPITVEAIMLGVDFVRVGMEDTMWLYPHKDEILKKNAEAVRKIATIAKELGRDIATPDEARNLLGIRL